MGEMSTADILQLLQAGALEMEGLLPWSSNYTFLVRLCRQPNEDLPPAIASAVYKPRRGERPLWDFTTGTLCQREQAAFLVSEALGWGIVPPTVLRDGPHGVGSVQFFVEHDPEQHYFTFEGAPAHRLQLQKIVLFDVLINNADRKSGHVLLQGTDASTETAISAGTAVAAGADTSEEPAGPCAPGRLWAIDHGVCFHTDYKLRTVIWEFAGQAIPTGLLADLTALKDQLAHPASPVQNQLKELLTRYEIAALRHRLQQLIKRPNFPQPGPGRHYPWPPV